MTAEISSFHPSLVENHVPLFKQSGVSPKNEQRKYLCKRKRTGVGDRDAMLAHELNTPIATASNILLGLQCRSKKSTLRPGDLELALTNALQQLSFTRNVIRGVYAEHLSGNSENFTQLDLAEQIACSIALLDQYLGDNACVVQVSLPVKPIVIQGDSLQLQQLLTNIIRNSVRAMSRVELKHRVIRITVGLSIDQYVVSIADNGKGCSQMSAPTLSAHSDVLTHGLGLGLQLCRSIVDRHQGSLSISAKANKGCVCLICLPRSNMSEFAL